MSPQLKVRNLFRLRKENKAIKDRTIRDIRILFDHKVEDHYKPVRVGNFWSNDYINYESNDDRNKTISVEEYLDKYRPFLKHIINNLKKSNTWKTQLGIAINFNSGKDNDEECVMDSKNDSLEIMIDGKTDDWLCSFIVL